MGPRACTSLACLVVRGLGAVGPWPEAVQVIMFSSLGSVHGVPATSSSGIAPSTTEPVGAGGGPATARARSMSTSVGSCDVVSGTTGQRRRRRG